MRDEYVPWNYEQVVAQLRAAGCTCERDPAAPGVSSSTSEVEGDSWSLRATHCCCMCMTRVKEIADPNYVMPRDVDR